MRHVCADGTVCVDPEPIGDGLFQVQETAVFDQGSRYWMSRDWQTIKRFRTLVWAEDWCKHHRVGDFMERRIFVDPKEVPC